MICYLLKTDKINFKGDVYKWHDIKLNLWHLKQESGILKQKPIALKCIFCGKTSNWEQVYRVTDTDEVF